MHLKPTHHYNLTCPSPPLHTHTHTHTQLHTSRTPRDTLQHTTTLLSSPCPLPSSPSPSTRPRAKLTGSRPRRKTTHWGLWRIETAVHANAHAAIIRGRAAGTHTGAPAGSSAATACRWWQLGFSCDGNDRSAWYRCTGLDACSPVRARVKGRGSRVEAGQLRGETMVIVGNLR